MLTGTNIEYAKVYNLRIIFEAIRLRGPISRAEISRLTALTKPTVSSIVQRLVNDELVIETGRRQGERGFPATQLEIDPGGAFAIGLDFDRDHLTGVLVDLSGEVRGRIDHDLDFPAPDEGLDLMAEVAQSLLAQGGVSRNRLIGVGAGFPGPLRISKGRLSDSVINPYFFPGWQNIPVVDALTKRLGLPVLLENNATAAAIGERWYGAGQALEHFFYLYFGTGLGGGLIMNGQPYSGFRGNAGEIGYLPTRLPQGRSYLGLVYRPQELYEELRLEGKEVRRLRELGDLYREDDPRLMVWLERVCIQLADALLAVEYLYDPEAIILGGRLPESLLDAIGERLDALLPTLRMDGKSYPARLLRAQAGEDAAALGLATLPIYASSAPNPDLLLKERHPKQGDRDVQRGAPWLVGG